MRSFLKQQHKAPLMMTNVMDSQTVQRNKNSKEYSPYVATLRKRFNPLLESVGLKRFLSLTGLLFLMLVPVLNADAATIGRPANNLGLVGYWNFDIGKEGATTVYDASGTGNTGTLTSATGTANWVDGKIGNGMEFDADDDYVDISSDVTYDSSEGTWAMWVNTSGDWGTDGGDPSDIAILMGRHDNDGFGSDGIHFLIQKNNLIQAQLKDGAGTISNPSGTAGDIIFDVWQHVALTFSQASGGTNTLYVNGESVASDTNSGAWSFNSQDILLADSVLTYWEEYGGLMDDVRIYNRMLSVGEINNLYKLGLAGGQHLGQSSTVVPDGLVGHWTFDGDVTNANGTKDISGNEHNATTTGTIRFFPGKLGQSVEFDSSSFSYYSIADHADFTGTDFTASAWVYAKEINAGDQQSIFSHYAASDPDDDRKFLIRMETDGTIGISRNRSGCYFSALSSGARSTVPQVVDEWFHVLMTSDAATTTLYIDGVLASTSPVTNGVCSDVAVNLSIGARLSGADESDLRIDDVRFYNRVLSLAEIALIYDHGAGARQNSSRTGRLTDGLVGHWTFDGNVTNTTATQDSSVNDNRGVLTGSPTSVIGTLGQALDFDGSDDKISMGDVVIDGLTSLTLSAWINPQSISASVPAHNSAGNAILDKGATGGDDNLAFYLGSTNEVYLYIDTGANYQVTTNTSPISINTWTHVVGLYDGSNLKIYVDGVEATTTAVTGTIISNALDLNIGSSGDNDEEFDGPIDDVRIYNRALSDDEINDLYNMGR